MTQVCTLRRCEQGGAAAQHAPARCDGIAFNKSCGVDPNGHDLAAEGPDVNRQSEVAAAKGGGRREIGDSAGRGCTPKLLVQVAVVVDV